eukprot:5149569-Amphidinium_carterae.2
MVLCRVVRTWLCCHLVAFALAEELADARPLCAPGLAWVSGRFIAMRRSVGGGLRQTVSCRAPARRQLPRSCALLFALLMATRQIGNQIENGKRCTRALKREERRTSGVLG